MERYEFRTIDNEIVKPLQLMVIDFAHAMLPTLVHTQIQDLRRRGVLRLLDSVVAAKGKNDELILVESLDVLRTDSQYPGIIARSFFGAKAGPGVELEIEEQTWKSARPLPDLGVTEDQLLEIADLIPASSRALILLIEHVWIADLEVATNEANGQVLANCWISPELITRMSRSSQSIFE